MKLCLSLDLAALACGVVASISFGAFMNIVAPFPRGISRIPRIGRGVAATVLQNFYDVVAAGGFSLHSQFAKQSGFRAAGYHFSFMKRIFIFHPIDIEHMIVRNGENYVKGDAYVALRDLLGNGLVTIVDGETHARHRRLVSPAFSPAALSAIANTTMREHTMALYECVRKNCRDDVAGVFTTRARSLIHRVALNIIAEAAFHLQRGELENVADAIALLLRQEVTILRIIRMLPVVGRWLPVQWLSKTHWQLRKVTRLVNEITRRIKNESPSTPGNGQAIIDYLISSKELSDNDIRDHSLTFMFAGFDTSSNTLQWALALLIRHADVQDRLFEELCDAVSQGACPAIEELRKCKFLDCVIRETLRLCPTVAMFQRRAVRDDVIPFSKVVIPSGSVVVFSIQACHRSPDIYGADADEFRPERWEDPHLVERCGLSGFCPFSLGVRNCIGKDFAWNEVSFMLAVIIRNFKVCGDGAPFPRGSTNIVCAPEDFSITFLQRQL